MKFKVTTEFKSCTLSGEIQGKGVQLQQLLSKSYDSYVPLNILEDLIEDLESVVNKIKELDNNTIYASGISIGNGGIIASGNIKATIHNGEKILSADNISNAKFKDTVKLSETTSGNIGADKSHDTDKVNSFDEIEQALNKAEQVFNIALNFGHDFKTAQELANNEKTASLFMKALTQINDEIGKLNKKKN